MKNVEWKFDTFPLSNAKVENVILQTLIEKSLFIFPISEQKNANHVISFN